MNADQPFNDQFEDNPQSWNLFSYVRNNPLNFVDPSGMATDDCPPGKVCTLDKEGKIETIEDDKDPIIVNSSAKTRPVVETLTLLVGRRFSSYFQRAMGNLGRWVRHLFGRPKTPTNPSTPPAQQPQTGGNQQSQPNQVYGPPNPRDSLPSASQRLENMNGLSRGLAQTNLLNSGFSLHSTTSGGNQQWRHSDGSVVWIMNNGRVVRIPTTSAAQQFGATGKNNGVRVDAATGQIMRSAQHHNSGATEIVQ